MTLRRALTSYLGDLVTENKRNLFEKILAHRTRYLQVVLDSVEDPLDANAAFRSCECFGIQSVHWLQPSEGKKMSPGVSVGATKWLDLYTYQTGDHSCVSGLRQAGLRQFALSTRSSAMPIEAMPLDRPLALWFASEHSGVSVTTAKQMDGFIRLPMWGIGDHFNFSVTVALALQAIKHRLEVESQPWQLSSDAQSHLLLEWYATIPKRRQQIVTRFLQEYGKTMADLAPPVTSPKFWAMMTESGLEF